MQVAQRKLVLGEGAGLVAAQHVHAGHLLDGDKTRNDRFEVGQALGANRHGDGQDRRQRHRDRGDGQDEGKLYGLDERVVAEQGGEPNNEHEADRHQDEEVADTQHRALEMGNGLGLLDETGGLAEIGLHSGRGDDAGHLALLGDGARIGLVPGLFVDRERFSRQRRLVDAQVIAFDQLQIGGNDIAQLDQHGIARHEQLCLDLLPLAVALDARLERKPLLQ